MPSLGTMKQMFISKQVSRLKILDIFVVYSYQFKRECITEILCWEDDCKKKKVEFNIDPCDTPY